MRKQDHQALELDFLLPLLIANGGFQREAQRFKQT